MDDEIYDEIYKAMTLKYKFWEKARNTKDLDLSIAYYKMAIYYMNKLENIKRRILL